MPDEGRRIEIQIAATGGEAAAAELRLPVQAQQELVTTSQAAAPAVDTVAGSLTAAGAAAGEAALAVGSVTEAVAATAATPVDPAMAFEFARIEERAAAAGEAVDRARRLAEKSGPLTGLQEMEFELQRITAEAQVADAALAKIESGQLALNGNMVATLRAKVRQADITAEIYGPEIEQAREAEAAIAAEAAAVAKAEELKKAAAAAAAIRHEEARARNEEKMLWRTRRRELNALTRGQGLGHLGRMPLGIDPGMLAGIVALGGAAMELQAHLKEVGGAIEEINTADLAKIDAQLAGQIDSWKELGTAISHPLDALEKWVNGISTPDAIKALNEEIKRNVDEQNAAMDAALEKGTVTAAALMKMAEELRIANHLLDSKDKTASTERDIRDEREEWAIRNSSEPEEMKERRIKELKKNRLHEDSEDEITRINRGVDEKKSGINE